MIKIRILKWIRDKNKTNKLRNNFIRGIIKVIRIDENEIEGLWWFEYVQTKVEKSERRRVKKIHFRRTVHGYNLIQMIWEEYV